MERLITESAQTRLLDKGTSGYRHKGRAYSTIRRIRGIARRFRSCHLLQQEEKKERWQATSMRHKTAKVHHRSF